MNVFIKTGCMIMACLIVVPLCLAIVVFLIAVMLTIGGSL